MKPSNERACSSCHQVLPLSKFAVDKRCRDGLSRRCKRCKQQKKKQRKETVVETDLRWKQEQEHIKPPSHKTCLSCKCTLPAEAFHHSNKTKDGLRSTCKACRKARQKEVQARYQQERAQYPITEKTCASCKHTLPIASFYLDKNTKDGYAVYCKECALRKQEGYVKTWEERRLATPHSILKKTCSRCHRTLAIDRFTKNQYGSDGYSGACKDCERERRDALITRWQHEETPMEKQCTYCKRILPASKFSKARKAKDGLLYMCKDCAATYYHEMMARWVQERARAQTDFSLFAVTEKTLPYMSAALAAQRVLPSKRKPGWAECLMQGLRRGTSQAAKRTKESPTKDHPQEKVAQISLEKGRRVRRLLVRIASISVITRRFQRAFFQGFSPCFSPGGLFDSLQARLFSM